MISILNTPTHYFYKTSPDVEFGIGLHQEWENDWYEYNQINSITIDKEKFLIPIRINFNTHHLLQGEKYFRLSEIHKNLLANKQAIVLFDYSMENYLYPEALQLIKNTIDKYNLHSRNSLFCSMYQQHLSDINTLELNYGMYLGRVLEEEQLHILENNLTRDKKCLTFCRKFTDYNHRYDFGNFIFNNDYQFDNIVTMPGVENPLTEFDLSLPWYYDFEPDEEKLEANEKFVSYNDAYNKTYVSFILETYFDFETYQDFTDVSEKFSNAVRHLHPFIIHSRPGYLKYIKKLGYKTFDKWWDESYDDIENTRLRKRMLYDLYKYINNKSLQELEDMRKEMMPILKHNCELYNHNKSNHKYFDQLFEKIRVCFSTK